MSLVLCRVPQALSRPNRWSSQRSVVARPALISSATLIAHRLAPTSPSASPARGQGPTAGQRPSVRCLASSRPGATEDDVVRYAAVGDIVNIHFVMRDEDGKVLQASATDLGEPITFEVGAGDMMGNRLFQGFDEAVRGMAVGQTMIMEASGGEWRRELLFAVPKEHPEVQRLEGRYKNHGGLAPGLIVELANGAMAVVLEYTDEGVKLDANNMLAGKTFQIELQLVSIDTQASQAEGSNGNGAAVPAA